MLDIEQGCWKESKSKYNMRAYIMTLAIEVDASVIV